MKSLGWLVKENKVSGACQLVVLTMIAEVSGFPPVRFEHVGAMRVADELGCQLKYAEAILKDGAKRRLWKRMRDPEDLRRWLYMLTPENWERAPRYRPLT